MRTKIIVAGVALAAVAGWMWFSAGPAQGPAAPTPDQIAQAETLQPADPALAALYQRSCMACHAAPDAQAPLTGHSQAWDARRAARGAEGLLRSAQQGYGNMPAMGLCPDCTATDFSNLISFMSGATS